MKVYLRSSDGQRTSIAPGKRIGGGGAGDVFQVASRPGEVVKIYRAETTRQAYAEKIEAMLAVPPLFPQVKKGERVLHQLAWPTAVAETETGKFLGFAMPEIDFKHAISLERMLQKRSRETSGLPAAYRHRVVAAFNTAALLTRLHDRGHHVIDLKPVNILLYRENMRLALVDCDGFSILGANKKRYSAEQYTAEYIAPENIRRRPAELGESQDRFSLAVIIFRLLNNGIHPYQGRLRNPSSGEQLPTLHEGVAAGLYAHGLTPHPRLDPSFATIHESFSPKLRELFDRAFQKPSNRPAAREWQEALRIYADPERGQLRSCEQNREEHAHFGHGCGWCDLDSRLDGLVRPARPARGLRRRKKSPARTRPTPQAQPIALAPLVHAGSRRWLYAALAAAGIALAMGDCSQLNRPESPGGSSSAATAAGESGPAGTRPEEPPSRPISPEAPSRTIVTPGLEDETIKKRWVRSRFGRESPKTRLEEPTSIAPEAPHRAVATPGLGAEAIKNMWIRSRSRPASDNSPAGEERPARRKKRLKQFR
ncbi:MAG: hypothetical protein VX574_11290 [Myxococcota bacterium]|nr:hypothetical protein [Myxococcota bacterium]